MLKVVIWLCDERNNKRDSIYESLCSSAQQPTSTIIIIKKKKKNPWLLLINIKHLYYCYNEFNVEFVYYEIFN